MSIAICSGIALGPFLFFRAGDKSASPLSILPAALSADNTTIRQALEGCRLGRLTIRTSAKTDLGNPGHQTIIIRTMRNTMIIVAPQDNTADVMREVDSGRGWILPWVMTVVSMPSAYLGFFEQIIGYKDQDHWTKASWLGRGGVVIAMAIYAIPAIAIGWFIAQLAMLIIEPRVLATYLSLTGKLSPTERLSLRVRLMLPITWSRVYNNSGVMAPPHVRVAASIILIMSMNLVASPLVENLVWWDEKPIIATIEEITHVDEEKETLKFLPDSGHPEQKLIVVLPDSTTERISSSSDTFAPGDSILLAETPSKAGKYRPVPAKSTIHYCIQVFIGLLTNLLGIFAVTYGGRRMSRKLLWLSPGEFEEYTKVKQEERRKKKQLLREQRQQRRVPSPPQRRQQNQQQKQQRQQQRQQQKQQRQQQLMEKRNGGGSRGSNSPHQRG